VYIISVAARMANMHPQTLRKYERAGLVSPSRTGGALRLYSDSDVRRLRIIRRLVGELGLNVAGVGVVLEIVRRLQDVMDVLEGSPDLTDSRAARLAAAELRTIFNYVGTDDDQAARKE
jgi:MerR family transcriptional regulator/heat shock protein HspR